jgi:Tfp pilus assembly protein PilP
MKTRLLLGFLLVTIAAGRVAAQQPPAKPQPAPTPAPAPATTPPPAPAPSAYTYNPEGRRDPFLSLLGRGDDARTPVARPPGIQGVLIEEVTVKGVLRDKTGFMAMLQAPDNKTYTVRVGDKLLDGSVKSISTDKVVFSQDVRDPLSLIKQREIPKPVRQAEGRGE